MARRGDGRALYAPAPQRADDLDDECYGLGIMCCEPAGGDAELDWKFVGQGRGGYEKVQTYGFVGHGAGSFKKEEVVEYQPTCRPRSECICLLLAAVIIFFIWAAPRLWGAGSNAVETATEKVLAPLLGRPAAGANGIEGTFVVETLRYADVAASGALNRSLVAAVQRALAAEAGSPIQPSQVEALLPSRRPGAAVRVDFVVAAVPAGRLEEVTARLFRAKPVESSIASELAAQTTVQAAATGPIRVRNFTLSSDARGSISASTGAPLSFDCDADFTECYECLRRSWSPAKLDWCCERRGRGCGTTTTPVVYDCTEGYETWRLGWSSIKKDFCCRSRGKGCEAHDDPSGRGGAASADGGAAGPDGVSNSSSSSTNSTSRNESVHQTAVDGA